MALSITEMDADFDSILTDIGTTVNINGDDVIAIVGNPNDEQLLMVGGDSDVQSVTVIASKADFDTLPVERDTVIIGTTTFSVRTIQNYPASAHITLVCSTNTAASI